MNGQKLRITSDGTVAGTKVSCDGQELPNVMRIQIMPMEPGQEVRAVVTFAFVELDVVAIAADDSGIVTIQHPHQGFLPNVD